MRLFRKFTQRRCLWLAALFVCVAAWGAWPAQTGAYVLEGPHVLGLMVEKLSGAKTLRVLQRVEIQDAAAGQQSVELTETLSYIFPNRFRSDAWYQGTNRIFVTSFGQFLTVIDQKVSAYQQGRFDRYKDPLLYQTRSSILKALLGSGIDVGVTSLGRSASNTAFVIGAQYPDTSVSQLWVDKERFLPLRLLLVESSDAGAVQHMEFVYKNWQSFGKLWYPMLIETFHNGHLIRRIQARNVMVDDDFSLQLLDIAYLMSVYASAGPDRPQAPPPDEDDVQRTIEDFKRKFDP